MTTTSIQSFTLAGPIGTEARPALVHVEILDRGPALAVAGVSPLQAKEIAVRVRSAVLAAGHEWPGAVSALIDAGPRPGAPALDLALAFAVLGVDAAGVLVAGEIGLDGKVRPVRGVFQAAQLARALGCRGIVVPLENVREALDALAPEDGVRVHSIGHLTEAFSCLATADAWRPLAKPRAAHTVDFAETRGMTDAIAAIERATVAHLRAARAGQASPGLLLEGPPGSGKTMLARRIPTILPALSRAAMEDVTRIYSAHGMASGIVESRPFRAPHHTISAMALGTNIAGARRPGEVQLAAHGVLLLDEIEEFRPLALEAVRDALATMGEARPLVVASANPCPCGWHGSSVRECTCTPASRQRHAERVRKAIEILGITLAVRVESLPPASMRDGAPGPSSESIRARITRHLHTDRLNAAHLAALRPDEIPGGVK